MYKKLILCSIIYFSYLFAQAQHANYEVYDNISLNAEASLINCFAQDRQGVIWVGSNKGLFSYDGFSSKQHVTAHTNTLVYCIVILNDSQLCLGTDNGVFFYDYQADQYITSDVKFPTDVRAMTLSNNTLWIGSLNGLFTYNLSRKTLSQVDTKIHPEVPHQTIYSIVEADNAIYIGTYNGLCRYFPATDRFEQIELPLQPKKSNQFVNIILEDPARQCIWIGTEGNLLKYIPSLNKIESADLFLNNSVKSLSIDEANNILVGTDNGLFVYKETTNSIQHIVHDSRNGRSLSNNIIWNIFSDREHNIWLGTDYNISLLRNNKIITTIPISQITGVGEGNRFHAIYQDSRQNFWLGGTNGLILTPTLETSKGSIWYQMGNHKYPLSHNRVRDIYEDRDQNIWIATDGSISRYDYQQHQFQHHTIVDSTHTYNSNWAYHIFEDTTGHLWIATCLGGIFVVDKHKLMASSGNYIAEKNYNTSNGLSGNFINQIIPDKEGNVWVLLYNNGINKIDIHNNKIYQIPINNEAISSNPNYLLCDQEGFVWAGSQNGLIQINPSTHQLELIRLNPFGDCEVLSMVEEGQHIWVSTTKGVWIVDKKSHEVQRINAANKAFTAGYYSKKENNIYWGGNDEVAVLSPNLVKETEHSLPIVLTSLVINGKPLESSAKQHGIRYKTEITLSHKQSNLMFQFSDLVYSREESRRFVYKLGDLEKEWNILEKNDNKITYNNLESGKYILSIASLESAGLPSDNRLDFTITITPPWYYTLGAKIMYLLIALGLVVWIINFFRVRNNLRLERVAKEKTQELSNLKMDFFTNVSHEFKTPLSMIIAPISKLLANTKDTYKHKELELIQRNALKLNSLIRQIIDFNRDDKANSGLILSQVEFVGFAKNLFAVYEEANQTSSIGFTFSTNKETIPIEIDVLKMEAILNNLLTNASRYTKQGNISLSLFYRADSHQLQIEVADTGIGIPKDELPYICERFFQSSKTSKDKDSTGIGLYIVKSYTLHHQGTIKIDSEENKGTVVTITLPTTEIAEISKSETENISNADKPLVLVVEDNIEIANFIGETLRNNYRCELCHNGKQGLDKCLELLPNLVVADIMMPVMDGLEMTRQIRRNAPTSTIPIILLTAKDDRKTELESININADAFISKPFDSEILLSRIEQILSNKKLIENQVRLETLSTPKPIEAISVDEKFLSEIIRIIEENIDDPALNVNMLSSISSIGSKQLYRKTKQLTGMSPVEYIRTIRLKKASMLLSKNKFTISEVMYMVGFSSASYFSKCFQAEFGKTPSQFIDEQS